MTTKESRTRKIALGFLLFVSGALAAPAQDETTLVRVAGVVRDAAGQALAGVLIEGLSGPESTETDAQGAFTLVLPPGSTLRASRSGYVTVTHSVDPQEASSALVLTLVGVPRLDESVVVEAVRAADWVPVTTRDVGRGELERLDHGQEMPFLLKETPSLTQYSDDGAEGGYSYLYLRGIPQTRLNLTLDGVPLTDARGRCFLLGQPRRPRRVSGERPDPKGSGHVVLRGGFLRRGRGPRERDRRRRAVSRRRRGRGLARDDAGQSRRALGKLRVGVRRVRAGDLSADRRIPRSLGSAPT